MQRAGLILSKNTDMILAPDVAHGVAVMQDAVATENGNGSGGTVQFPAYIETFLASLETDWPQGSAPQWCTRERIAYGRQIAPLAQSEVRELYYHLRAEHTFRPSVVAVREAASDLRNKRDGRHLLPATG